MKKLFLILIFLKSAYLINAQSFINSNPGTYGYKFNRGAFSTTLLIPTISGTPSGLSSLNSVLNNQAGLIFDSTGHKLYTFDPSTKSWSIAGGILPSDTAAMLSPYLRNAGYGLLKSGQTILADTSVLVNKANTQIISGFKYFNGGLYSQFMQTASPTIMYYQDGNINQGASAGTIGLTENNFYLSFSHTSSVTKQTLNFPPANSRTYFFPDATGTVALTSDIPSITGKLNISDTASMLSPYSRDYNTVHKAGTEVISGYKSLNNTLSVAGGILFATNSILAQGGGLSGNPTGFAWYNSGSSGGVVSFPTDSLRSYLFPSKTGTVALTSDIPSLSGVPYTGATGNVNLGTYGLTANAISGAVLTSNGAGSFAGTLYLKQNTSYFSNSANYAQISSGANTLLFSIFNGTASFKTPTFNFGSLTDATARTYTFPNASGTLALTSDLSSYVPYTGATADVNLGVHNITLGSGTNGGHIDAFGNLANAYFNAEVSGGRLVMNGTSLKYTSKQFGGTKAIDISTSATTGNDFVIALPNATGTLALTSDIPSITGKLNISDTALMLSAYYNKTASNALLTTKENTITTGTTAQYYRGDKTFQTLNTAAVAELTNLYYTDARARGAISLTTTGTSGAATYNNSTGVLNIPQYSDGGGTSTYVPYTGAASDVNLGSRGLIAGSILGTTSLSASSSSESSGILNITNTGAGRIADFQNSGALVAYITNAGSIYGSSFVKSGGSSSQFLKADGSVDSSPYVTASGSVNYANSADNANYLGGYSQSGFVHTNENGIYTIGAGGGSESGVIFYGSNYGAGYAGKISNSNSDGTTHFYSRNGSSSFTDIGYFDATGMHMSSYGSYSDIRLKNVIETNPNINLDSIDVIKYTMKNAPNIIRYGYSAQQVQSILPDLVNTSSNLDGTNDILTLNYNDLHTIKIATLEKKLQEQKIKIEELKTKYNALEARILALENK